jgi:hypothetical protein
MRAVRRSASLVGVVGMAGMWCTAVVGITLARPAAADIDECEDSQAQWCLEEGVGGGTPVPAPGEGNEGSRDLRSPAPTCGWETIPADRVPAEGGSPAPIFTNGQPPAGLDVVWQGWCYYHQSTSVVGDFRGPFRWLPVAAAPPMPTAEDVAADAYEAVKGRVPEVSVVTSPPLGADAVVDVPVFVSVTNWQDQIVETRLLLGDSVTVVATPEVAVDPAEPGGVPVTCEGAGRPYEPAAGDLWAQAAAPEACTFAYQHRTGVEGRPNEWGSTVTVRWSIAWSATTGESGVFPAVEQSVSIARGVTEVQSVLVGGAD